MSFDKIFDLTAGVYFHFLQYVGLCLPWDNVRVNRTVFYAVYFKLRSGIVTACRTFRFNHVFTSKRDLWAIRVKYTHAVYTYDTDRTYSYGSSYYVESAVVVHLPDRSCHIAKIPNFIPVQPHLIRWVLPQSINAIASTTAWRYYTSTYSTMKHDLLCTPTVSPCKRWTLRPTEIEVTSGEVSPKPPQE